MSGAVETSVFFSHLSKFEAAGSMAVILLCPVGMEGHEATDASYPAKPCPAEAGRPLAITPSATELLLQQHKNQNIPLRNLLVSLI